MIVELVDSVVEPLMAVSDELSEVKKGLSKIQKAFESLTYQPAMVKEQLESDSKTLTQEREALEILVKKFNTNLVDLENLNSTLSREVRSGTRSASETLLDAIRNEVEASVRQTVDVSASALAAACHKNIKIMNDYETLAFSMNIKWMLLWLVAAFVIAMAVFMSFRSRLKGAGPFHCKSTHYFFR
jgi:chromosome segregation ATPase